MFTGLIEQTGTLKDITRINGGTGFTIAHGEWAAPLQPGESIAVNGACLTVTRFSPREFQCDALDETLARTTLGSMKKGACLNLERALRFGDRVGGHFVSGHVDGTARVAAIRRAGRDFVLRLECGCDLLNAMVMKGSVACDGISLTISALSDSYFEVNIIPLTWSHTAISGLAEGDLVNIETDMLGKYVNRCLTAVRPPNLLDLDQLRRAGFLD